MKEGYEAATVTLKDGRVVTGFKQADTGDGIAIREMNGGEIRTLQRSEIAGVQSGGTVMADGLTATMSEQELAHLIRYLSELGN